MSLQLTADILHALNQSPDGMVQVETRPGEHVWIMTEQALRIQQQVRLGVEQAERGECVPFDAEAIIREGHRRLNQKK